MYTPCRILLQEFSPGTRPHKVERINYVSTLAENGPTGPVSAPMVRVCMCACVCVHVSVSVCTYIFLSHPQDMTIPTSSLLSFTTFVGGVVAILLT